MLPPCGRSGSPVSGRLRRVDYQAVCVCEYVCVLCSRRGVCMCLPPEDPGAVAARTAEPPDVTGGRLRLVMKESIQASCSGEKGGGSVVGAEVRAEPATAVVGGTVGPTVVEAVVMSTVNADGGTDDLS